MLCFTKHTHFETHTHTHTHTHTQIHTQAQTHTGTNAHTGIHKGTHTPECTMVPSSERMINPQQSGMECVTRTGWILEGQGKCKR